MKHNTIKRRGFTATAIAGLLAAALANPAAASPLPLAEGAVASLQQWVAEQSRAALDHAWQELLRDIRHDIRDSLQQSMPPRPAPADEDKTSSAGQGDNTL